MYCFSSLMDFLYSSEFGRFFDALKVLLPLGIFLLGIQFLWSRPRVEVEIVTWDAFTDRGEVQQMTDLKPVAALLVKMSKDAQAGTVVFPEKRRLKPAPDALGMKSEFSWYRLPGGYIDYETFLREASIDLLSAHHIDATRERRPLYDDKFALIEDNPFLIAERESGVPGSIFRPPISTTQYFTRVSLKYRGSEPLNAVTVTVPGTALQPFLDRWGATSRAGVGSFSIINFPFLPAAPDGRTFIVETQANPVPKKEVQVEAPLRREISKCWFALVFSLIIGVAFFHAFSERKFPH